MEGGSLMRSFKVRSCSTRGIRLAVFAAGVLIILAGSSLSQVRVAGEPGESPPLNRETRSAIVDSVTTTLNTSYVFEDVAKKMEKELRRKLKKGEYDTITSVQAFTQKLTEDLQGVSNDRHLRVSYAGPEALAQLSQTKEDPAVARERELRELQKRNFAFKKVEILDGNVGYLRFDQFVGAGLSGPTATAAMNFLANCDAVIVDVRQNGGGEPSLIQYLMGYFLEEPTHLNSFYTRNNDSLEQYWSAPWVAGPSMTGVDLFVLTSARTFSGAEEFAYNIKNLKRGTIVGETTGGGAHPIFGAVFPSLNVRMSVPYARAINPISGTNWEGTGVAPDIQVPEADALDTAYLEALKRLRDRATDDDRWALDWAFQGLDAKLHPVAVAPAALASYAGMYGPRVITIEDGALVYQREGRPAMRGTPITETLFGFEDAPQFRLEIVLDREGTPTKIVGHYDNGMTDESPRTE
jgi:C-terminal processing protease CtpA/Prc